MAPTVDVRTANLANNATSIVITGTGFDTTAANNTVVFNNGAVGTVASATATQLNVNLTTPPTNTGSLTVVVTTSSISNGSPVQVATVVATAASPRVSIPDLLTASDDGASDSDNITSIQTPIFTGVAPASTTIELIDQANNILGTTTSDSNGNWTITSSTLSNGSYSIKARYFSTTYSMTQLTSTAGTANIPAAITIAPGDRLYSPAAPSEDGYYRDLPDAASSGNSLTDTWNDLVAAYNAAKGFIDWGDFPGDSFEVTLTGPSFRGNNITYVVVEGVYATPRGSGRQLDSGDWIIALTNDLDGDSAGSSITTTPPNVIPSSYLLSSSALNISIIPGITSATYDATTGVLSVTGTNFAATGGSANDIDVSKLTITAEGGATRTLTSSSVEITSATTFSVTLNGTDKAALNQIVNKNGTASTGGTTYNIAAASNWNPANSGAADLTGNGITVSNVAVPAITSASYDSATGTLVVTGTGFLKRNGTTNDIDVSKLTIRGEGGSTYTLTTSNVEITSGTSFSVTLNSADQTGLSSLLNKNGTSSIGATTYNIAAAEDWAAGANAADAVADLTGNGITVSNKVQTFSVSQSNTNSISTSVEIASAGNKFSRINSNSYYLYINGGSNGNPPDPTYGTREDRFIFTFGNGKSFYLTDFNGWGSSGNSQENIVGIPAQTSSSSNSLIAVIPGNYFGGTFDLYDNTTGERLLNDFQSQDGWTGYGNGPAIFEYDVSTGEILLKTPYRSGSVDGSLSPKVSILSTGALDYGVNTPESYRGGLSSATPISIFEISTPQLVGAATNSAGTQIILTYGEALGAVTAAASRFAVTVGGTSAAINSVTTSGSTVILALASTIGTGQSVSVAYTDPTSSDDSNAIQDLLGNDSASLGSTIVINNVPAPSSPPSSGSSDPEPEPEPVPVVDTTPSDPAPAGTNIQTSDDDGDGLREVVIAPDGTSVDGNRDGIPDATQRQVAGLRLINDGAAGSDYGATSVSDGIQLEAVTLTSADTNGDFSVSGSSGGTVVTTTPSGITNALAGVVSFTVSGVTPGGTTEATLSLPTGLASGSGNAYLRFNYSTNRFEEYVDTDGKPLYTFVDSNGDGTVDGVKLTLVDGDPNWDGDGVANGTVVDPGFYGNGDRTFTGTKGRDTLIGNVLANTISGYNGNDTLTGDLGNDILLGGNGRDLLTGGEGSDQLSGGGGRDRFIYTSITDSRGSTATRDTITDFRGGDKIDLSAIDANASIDGNQAFTFIKKQAFTGASGELRFSNGLLEADINGDREADFAIALTGINRLYASSFVL